MLFTPPKHRHQPWVLALCIAVPLSAPLSTQAAIDIQFDYTYDGGFFTGANTVRQAALELAASTLESRLVGESFSSLVPAGSNTLTLSFDNPSNVGTKVTLTNPVIAANTLKIYVGGSNLGASDQLGNANFSLGFSGNSTWFNTVSARNTTSNYEPVGGSITFNSATNWYFGTDPSGLQSSQYDLFTVATHEIIHLLGFGQSSAFSSDTSGSQFVGSNVQALAGGPVDLDGINGGHWAQSTTVAGQTPLMVPALGNGVRRQASELEFAALRDIGYTISPVPEASTWAMAALGLLAITWVRRHAHNKAEAVA